MTKALPLWFETGTLIVLTVILLVDLALIIKRPHVPKMREASLWVGFYVLLALVFAGAMFAIGDKQHGLEFLVGWLTEYSLSIDNLFVFVLILAAFQVPPKYQQRALMIGIVFALVLRLAFILLGAAILERFHWVFLIFGLWLLWTAIQQVKGHGEEHSEGAIVKAVRKTLPYTDTYDGAKLFTRIDGKRYMTPFLLVLISLGMTDLVFALDSIPAIFGVTKSPFIVFTANIFALMGLRQLYFLLGGLLEKLEYLHYGIAAILGFIGVKLIAEALADNTVPFINNGQPIEWIPHFGIIFPLVFIVSAIVISAGASLWKLHRDSKRPGGRIDRGLTPSTVIDTVTPEPKPSKDSEA